MVLGPCRIDYADRSYLLTHELPLKPVLEVASGGVLHYLLFAAAVDGELHAHDRSRVGHALSLNAARSEGPPLAREGVTDLLVLPIKGSLPAA